MKLLAADTILLDFESSTVTATISSWTNYAVAGKSASNWSTPNPFIETVNPTSNCYKVVKSSGDPYWTGLDITLTTPITITADNKYLHVLIYKTTTTKIALTYTPDGGTQIIENWQSNNTKNAWIDYILVLPVGTNIRKFAVKLGDDAGDYYIDQMVLSSSQNSTSITPSLVDPATRNQTIEGWGGSLCWWANIMGGYDAAKVKDICDWITDPVNGLNMNLFRFNIGGGDNPTHTHIRKDGGEMPGYKASATSSYNWNQDANQRRILQQLIASRIANTGVNDVKLIAFSNSPPYWMTVSGCSSGSVEGNVCNLLPDMFDDFADYLTEVTKYYHDNLGITFDYLEPFNEPDGTWWKKFGNQEGCYFSTSDQLKMIRELYSKMSQKNMLSYCQITANDANNMDNGLSALNSYKSAGDILPKMNLISVHSYYGSNRSGLASFAKSNNLKLWQTESGPLDIEGGTAYRIMTVSDRIISDMRTMKCTAWLDWQLASDGSPNWGLLVGTYSDKTNPVTKAISYYVRTHFSRFLKSGYTVISNSASNVLTAVSPDNKELVIVVSNKEAYARKFSIDLSKFSDLGRVTQIRTRAQESIGTKLSVSAFDLTSTTLNCDMSSETIITFVIPINQIESSVNEVDRTIGDMYFSDGYLYTNFNYSDKINLAIYNSLGQQVCTMQNVNANGRENIKLKSGFYIIIAKTGNKTISRKILV